ncbi:hypothetical protein P20652_3311 [Pseudoalteromonas sp. BSi20652]|uniref:SGNH/GDSL hydrolase family protein n=1 Tax=Pseudoalteromonas sp. BSi20652 TaxID=388384 RepID=UPI000231ABC7|nr:SGNH/GDSL hydrolase family protein [Pseudoalteromonas sp. BSi20652]GAA61434.1 hypothetical protein P20652_3311 [Pseudoalteromonas sp. BSi20652]
MTKNILCFGDSNTWGLNPVTGKRFDENNRWTSLLNKNLGCGFNVIEAGQPNRTLVHNPPFDGVLSGVSYLKPYLDKHELDFIIIALGTNDLKKRFNLTPSLIADGLNDLISQIKGFYNLNNYPQIVILAPAYVKFLGLYKHIYEGAECKNSSMSIHFERVALDNGVLFYNLQGVVSVSLIDGVHITSEGHSKVADAVFEMILSNTF